MFQVTLRREERKMDPITSAVVAALSAGAANGLTDTNKTAINDGYYALKDHLAKKCGAKSEVVQAITHLEANPASHGRQETLWEEITAAALEQDADVLAKAKHMLALVQLQQTGLGKFTIHNDAPVQGQNIGDHNTITQHFGDPKEMQK